MMKQDMPPVEWLSDRMSATGSKLRRLTVTTSAIQKYVSKHIVKYSA